MLVLHTSTLGRDGALEKVTAKTAHDAAHILRAFAIPHALALSQVSAGQGDWEELRAIGSFILTSNKDRFTASDFTAGVRALRGLGMWDLRNFLSRLVALGWLGEEENPAGGPVKAWVVPPGLRRYFADRAKAEAERKARLREMIQGAAGQRRGDHAAP